MDYCATYEEDPSYQMKYSCLEESGLCYMNFGIAKQGYVSIMLGEDPSTNVSCDIISKAFSYLGNLMMDLRLSEENANRIVLTVLQLINGCSCLFQHSFLRKHSLQNMSQAIVKRMSLHCTMSMNH